VIDALDPRPKARVEIGQILDTTGIELTQKLIAKGAVPALELGLLKSIQLHAIQTKGRSFFG
jgi:hypothetical protein